MNGPLVVFIVVQNLVVIIAYYLELLVLLADCTECRLRNCCSQCISAKRALKRAVGTRVYWLQNVHVTALRPAACFFRHADRLVHRLTIPTAVCFIVNR